MALRASGDGSDWFFLAMSLWRLGARDQARCWCHRAAAWMEQKGPNDDEPARWRAKAEALIGRPVD
jgi:hypothetical protein